MSSAVRTRLTTWLTLGCLLCAGAPRLVAQEAPAPTSAPERSEPLPPELEGVGIDEHLDALLPLEAEFTAHDGRRVKLGDYFDGKRPVLLTLNYYRCPMLCGLMLNGMVDSLKNLDASWTAGQQFQVVTVSFDPLETPQLATLKRNNYLEYYGRPAADAGWHFLTGRKKSIDALLEATGFRIRWNEQRKEWMHAAALIVCTPNGHISRYLYGIMFEPRTVRLSLVEASEGKIATTLDRVLLFCYHYDGTGYSLAAMNIARLGGGVTLLAVAVLLVILWSRERQRGKAASTVA